MSHLLIPALFFLVILVGAFIQPAAARKPYASIPVKNLFSYIEILPPGSRVLLAWDYDPATQGEMQLLAQPILRHLQRKRVQIVNVSLRPFGPNVAADAQTMKQWPMSAQAAAPTEFGFIPGESAALRALTHSPVIASNQPRTSARTSGLRPTDTLAAFDLVIEFSASFANSQEWVEQVASRTQKPFIVAASGAVAPLLRPYQQTHQIRVLLSGYPDALAYESLLQHNGPAHRQRTAQTLALGLLLILVLIAATRSLLRR
ncbi:MAG: hypothetical protein DSY55_05995 [Clostridia bacterium]|nr:MAG: hypothetical protein DSY55_05995 [Clostridia bacterium]